MNEDIYTSGIKKKSSVKIQLFTLFTNLITRLSPRLSAHFATKILCNPHSRRDYKFRTKIQPELITLPTSEGDIALFKFQPLPSSREDNEGNYEGKNVFLSHGWADSTKRFTELINHLNRNGFTVWSIDHLGHGKSFGETAHLFNFILGTKAALKYLQENESAPSALIGHSMGCLSLLNLENKILQNKKIVFISAPVKFFENMFESILNIGISKVMLTNLLDSISQRHKEDWAKFSPHLHKHKINTNFLIAHDDQDPVCSYENMKNLVHGRPHQFITTSGLGHLVILKDSFLLNEICKFIKG